MIIDSFQPPTQFAPKISFPCVAKRELPEHPDRPTNIEYLPTFSGTANASGVSQYMVCTVEKVYNWRIPTIDDLTQRNFEQEIREK